MIPCRPQEAGAWHPSYCPGPGYVGIENTGKSTSGHSFDVIGTESLDPGVDPNPIFFLPMLHAIP